MDTRPFRAPRPAARETTSRAEAPREQPAPPQPNSGSPSRQASAEASRPPKRRGRWILPLVVVIVLVAVAVGALLWVQRSSAQPTVGIDASKYQAVHLTNGQVVIGKMENIGNGYFRLSHVYRLQPKATSDSDQSQGDDNVFQLVKLDSGEPYSPEDAMVIAGSQIFYFENLQPDGKASQFIKKDGTS